ncbi:diguanylate cyclase (GGDEF)-like protein [Actinoplanes lutulentus]|uniref:GGDEF domain-containing protein n=1 Tax=Actinoplanes lutulentus TaxID=1287878 RepID=UPI0015ECD70C|nr:GGDEF domain-containing protein [Actinoplanes lutulentus]MBB2948508.1 diguanylate cyclase (GGDEF)-like protein [Actinoplanes lutulentus]
MKPPGQWARLGVPVGFLVVATGFTAGYLTGSEPVRLLLMLLSGVLATLGIAMGVRVNRLPDRRPWLLTMLALVMLSTANAAWYMPAAIHGGQETPAPWLAVVPQLVGYVFFLAASLMIVLRHTPRDASGTIDAAVWGIAAAAPVWEFLFRPQMLAKGDTTAAQLFALTQLLVLFGICGALLRVARTSGRGNITLWFLFGALGLTLLGTAVVNMLPADSDQGSVPALLFAVGYLSLGAAGLHPSAHDLMNPRVRATDRAPKLQLGMFGAAMLMVPVVGAIGQLAGSPVDGPLLTIAPMLTIPLVLIRIGRLNLQRSRDREALAHQASHDELTGLVNRRRLFTVMETAIARHADGLGGDLALLYCDLNDFKPINDRYGHEAGDAVLRATAHRITGAVRSGDVVARIGGDEFLIFCPDADSDTAYALGTRIVRALSEPVSWRGETLRVSTALGTTVWTQRRTVGPDDLLAIADAQMYENKRTQSHRSVYCLDEASSPTLRTSRM